MEFGNATNADAPQNPATQCEEPDKAGKLLQNARTLGVIGMHKLVARIMVLALGLACSLWVSAKPLRIGTWDTKHDTLVVGGQAVLAHAYAEVKQEVEFVDLPSRRALMLLAQGELDGNIFRIADLAQEYPKLYRVETPVTTVEIRVYSVDPQRQIENWAQLDGLRVAYLRGTLLIERNLPPGSLRLESASVSDMFRLASSGVADVVIMSDPAQSPPHPLARPAGLTRLDGRLASTHLHHYLLGKHQELGQRLNLALKKMAANGEMQIIRAKAVKALE